MSKINSWFYVYTLAVFSFGMFIGSLTRYYLTPEPVFHQVATTTSFVADTFYVKTSAACSALYKISEVHAKETTNR